MLINFEAKDNIKLSEQENFLQFKILYINYSFIGKKGF